MYYTYKAININTHIGITLGYSSQFILRNELQILNLKKGRGILKFLQLL
jgi:hypothetical protein